MRKSSLVTYNLRTRAHVFLLPAMQERQKLFVPFYIMMNSILSIVLFDLNFFRFM